MRVLACSDLHGDMAALKKILENADRKANVIVIAGDLTGYPRKSEIRILSVARVLMKFFNANEKTMARRRDKKITERVERGKKGVNYNDNLPKKSQQLPPNNIKEFSEFVLLKGLNFFRLKIIKDYQSKQLAQILKSLDKCKVPSLLVIGNDDLPSLDKLIGKQEKEYSNFTNINKKIVSHQDNFFFGYGGAVRKNMKLFNDWEENICRKEISEFTDKLKDLDPLIFVSHCPPHACLDSASSRVLFERGSRHIGSHTLREIIQEIQPKYFVCGHSHRDGGKTERIRKTTVVNVATARIHPRFGGRYAVIDTEKDIIEWFSL